MTEKIIIDGAEYSLNSEKEEFREGHVYCKICGERVDSEAFSLLGKKLIFSSQCLCERKKAEQFEKMKRDQRVLALKAACFHSHVQSNYTFENYQGQKDSAYITAFNYAKDFAEMRKENIGLIFFGNVGSGKSYLASCIANDLIERELLTVKMRNFSEIINELQTGGFNLDRNKYIDSFTNAPLLILDDLGIERDTAYAKEQVYNVINSRYLKQKPTIITTNLPWQHILNTNDSMEYQRIYSRIVEMCIPVQVRAEDYRKKINDNKLAKYREMLTRRGDER